VTSAPALSGQDLGAAANATRPLLDRVIEPAGLSFSEWVVLRLLAVKGGAAERAAFVTDLASNLRIDQPAAARLVDDAAAAGRLETHSEVRLSDAGAALYSRLWGEMSRVQSRLYGDFDQRDLETTRRVLAEVTRRATELLQTT
jgi:DNA-binding MarR family transcriptional regulator